MKVNLEGKGPLEVSEGSTVKDIVDRLDHHIDSVIVVNEGSPVPLDEEVEEGQNLKVISVVSGG